MLSRELFWGIEYGWITYMLALVVISSLGYMLRLRVAKWRQGRDEKIYYDWRKNTYTLFTALLSQRLLKNQKALGVIHLSVSYGFVVLFAGTVLLMVDTHLHLNFLVGNVFVIYKFVLNLFGLLALLGITILILRRYSFRYASGDNDRKTLFALMLPFIVILTGFIVEGSRLAITIGANPGWQFWAFPVYPIVVSLQIFDSATIGAIHTALWWIHMLVSFLAITALGWTKLLHIWVVPLNFFHQTPQSAGRLRELNLVGKEFGVAKLSDFTRPQLIAVSACVSAGRCEVSCPAFNSDQPLSPKVLMEKLQQIEDYEAPLMGDAVSEESIWACTTCGACQQKCPTLANPVEKIVELRRHRVMAAGSVPSGLQAAMINLQKRGHPWSAMNRSRLDWMKGLDIPLAAQKKQFDVLFWVGCTGALVDRNIKVTIAVAKILQQCGIDFAVLGQEENCTCHSTRRAGNEHIYQIMAQKNIVKLQQYSFGKIVTACPHCYHTLKNEYNLPERGMQVISHIAYLQELLQSGLLKVKPDGLPVTLSYHDPCYYGRINNIINPSRVICTLLGIPITETANSREDSFCCGGGGGGIWLDDKKGQRMNEVRVKQLLANKTELIGTACPFCLQMLETAVSSLGYGDTVKVRDITEIIEEQLL